MFCFNRTLCPISLGYPTSVFSVGSHGILHLREYTCNLRDAMGKDGSYESTRKTLVYFFRTMYWFNWNFGIALCSVIHIPLLNRDLKCLRSGATATPSPTFTFSPPLQLGSGSLDFISWLLPHNAFHTLSKAKTTWGWRNSGHFTLRLNFCQESTFRQWSKRLAGDRIPDQRQSKNEIKRIWYRKYKLN
jgi:hypothetical protein